MIGANDVWRQYDSPRQTERHVLIDEYEKNLVELVTTTKPLVKGLVLMTPFYLEPNRQDAMRATMDRYGAVVNASPRRRRACSSIPRRRSTACSRSYYPATINWDRVHPNPTGSAVLARAFLSGVGFDWLRGRLTPAGRSVAAVLIPPRFPADSSTQGLCVPRCMAGLRHVRNRGACRRRLRPRRACWRPASCGPRLGGGLLGALAYYFAPTLADGLSLRFDGAVLLPHRHRLRAGMGRLHGAARHDTGHRRLQRADRHADRGARSGGHRRAACAAASTPSSPRSRSGSASAARCSSAPSILELGPATPLGIVLVKLLLNGVLNVVIAQMAGGDARRRRLLRGRGEPAPVRPLRAQVFEHVMPMTVLPIVFLGVGLARLFTVSEERQASRELAARAAIIGQRIAGYVERHEAAIRALAHHLASRADAARRRHARPSCARTTRVRTRC